MYVTKEVYVDDATSKTDARRKARNSLHRNWFNSNRGERMKTYKMSTFTDLGESSREDVNQLISALVRMGYEVWMIDNYICFNTGNDDIIKEKENEQST